MNYYIETAGGNLCFHDVEFSPRTKNAIDRYNNRVDDLQRFLDNHPKLLQRKNPDPALIATLVDRQKAVSDEVVTAFVLRGADGLKIRLDAPTYLCAWDGAADYVVTLVGAMPAGGVPFFGWPDTDIPPDAPAPLPQSDIDAAIAKAATREAARAAWSASAGPILAASVAGYQAWLEANPYPG